MYSELGLLLLSFRETWHDCPRDSSAPLPIALLLVDRRTIALSKALVIKRLEAAKGE